MMEYEILLVNVVRDFGGYSDCFRESIGQYLLASYLRTKSFKAFVYSGNAIETKKIISNEIEKNKVPVIGFYAAADNIRIVKHIITWIKTKYPYIITIIGGPQAIGLDYHFFSDSKNDYAIVGEGEIPLHMLLSSIIDKDCLIEEVPAIVYPDYEKKKLIINQCDNAVIKDLDIIPYPTMQDSLLRNLRQGKMAGIITGRGCPNHCTFCYEGANAKNVRFRSIDNVMEEIDYIIENNSKFEYLNIYDDTFTLRKDRVLDFCKKISKRNIKWFCEGHVTFVLKNSDVISEMIKAGMLCIQFGIESGSNKVLQGYNKKTDYHMIVEAITICKKMGIHGITGNFIIGGAFETVETIEESKRLAKDLIYGAKGIIELYSVYFAPYPNTKIVNKPYCFNIKLNSKFQEYNLNTMRSPVVETKELTTVDIYNLKEEFDLYLEEVYHQAAIESTKADVIQGLFVDGKREHLNPIWERHYMSLEYIVNFIEHLSETEQQFNENFYMIRTFEDVVLDGEVLVSKYGKYTGLDKEVLLNATGIYTAKEMAEMFGVSLDEIKKIFIKYNDKCMLYMSEF